MWTLGERMYDAIQEEGVTGKYSAAVAWSNKNLGKNSTSSDTHPLTLSMLSRKQALRE